MTPLFRELQPRGRDSLKPTIPSAMEWSRIYQKSESMREEVTFWDCFREAHWKGQHYIWSYMMGIPVQGCRDGGREPTVTGRMEFMLKDVSIKWGSLDSTVHTAVRGKGNGRGEAIYILMDGVASSGKGTEGICWWRWYYISGSLGASSRIMPINHARLRCVIQNRKIRGDRKQLSQLPRDGVRGKWKVTLDGCDCLFCGSDSILELDRDGDCTTLWIYKNHWLALLKRVNFMIHKYNT